MADKIFQVIEIYQVRDNRIETTAQVMEARINLEVAKGYDVVKGSFQVTQSGAMFVLMEKIHA